MDPATVECTPKGKQGALRCQDLVVGGCLDPLGFPPIRHQRQQSDALFIFVHLRDVPSASPAVQPWLVAQFARVRAGCRGEPGRI